MDDMNNENRNDNRKPNPNRKRHLGINIALYVVVAAILTIILFVFIKPFGNTSNSKNTTVINDIDMRMEETSSGEKEYKGILADVLNSEYVLSVQTKVYGNDQEMRSVQVYYYKIDYKNEITTGVQAGYVPILNNTRYMLSGKLNHEHYTYMIECMEKRDAKVVKKVDKTYYITQIDDVDENGVVKKYYSSDIYTATIPSSNSFMSYLPFLLSTGVGIIILAVFVSRANKNMRDNMRGAQDVASSKARKELHSKVRFKDVAGCDEVKAELVELVDYFKNAEKYTRLGAKLPKGFLLVGPPGTGKTLLAKAVAGEANVPFYSVSGSDFVEMYVGVGASRVRDMFKNAKQNSPCLIFIDEIDAVGRQRGAGLGGGNDEREQTLNQLLVEMDGFEENSGIIIIAATNRADVLDPALTRAGRFDRQITVDLPDKEGREAILKVHSRNKKLAKDVDFGAIASRTTGFSGADLANIINDAAILAVRAKREVVTTQDIDEAIDRQIAGPAKSNKHLQEKEKKQIAYHESGHAIIGLFLPYAHKVQKVTIIPRGRTGGHVLMTPEQDQFLMTKNELMAEITGFLGGRTSEEIFFEDVSTGASNDIQMATRIAKSMVTEYGMSPLGPIQYEQPGGSVFLGRDYNDTQKNFSSQIAYEIDKEVRNIVEECHKRAKELLIEHKEDVILMAETLMKVETLTAEQIAYLLEHRELPVIDEHKADDKKEVSEVEVVKEEDSNYFGKAPQCDEINKTIQRLLSSNPECVVVIAENSDPSVEPTKARGIKSKITRYTGGRKFVILMVKQDKLNLLEMSSKEFGEKLENTSGLPVLLIETSNETIDELTRDFSQR